MDVLDVEERWMDFESKGEGEKMLGWSGRTDWRPGGGRFQPEPD